MTTLETFSDHDEAYGLLKQAFQQYNNHKLDPKSKRRFLGHHSKALATLVETCNQGGYILTFKNGATKLQKYAVDLSADGLPKPEKQLGKVLESGGTFPLAIGIEAAPVTPGLYREYFFGSQGMNNDPSKPGLMFCMGDMMEAYQIGGAVLLK